MRRPRLETQPRANHALVSNLVRHGPTPDLSVFRAEWVGPAEESLTLTPVTLDASPIWRSSPISVTGASLRTLFRLRLDDRFARQAGFHFCHVSLGFGLRKGSGFQ
jgi:hypothetical protein